MIPEPKYWAGWRAHTPGQVDAHGNPADEWAAAVPLPVLWVAPGAMTESGTPRRDLSEIEWTVCTPAPCPVGARDLLVVDGVEYAVSGEPRDWTRGPWPNPAAAVVIELKRSEG